MEYSRELKAEMRAYKAEGHTNKEVAERFRANYESTKTICRRVSPQTNKGENARRSFLDKLANYPDWEYIDGYKQSDGTVRCRCKNCGTISEISCQRVRKGEPVECPECRRREKLINEHYGKQRKFIQALNREQRKLNRILKYHECLVCGKMTDRPMYCSSRCSKRISWHNGEVKRRAKIQAAMVDKDISLETLYKRDKGVCYICGEICKWDDYKRKGKWFVAGEEYPSIDHVIPLSKGGKHSWDNVRLACRGCNTRKSAKT